MRTPESKEKKKIREYLDSIGAWHCLPGTYGFGKSGVPDIIACYENIIRLPNRDHRVGVFIGIEVKREGAEPTMIQNRRLNEIRTAGGIAVWGTAEKVIKELREIFE